ncbi:tripartite tricarboxylate transporter permease [Halorarum salinum]|uniref:tripartite tricarboxylate transporter permease n=1 Tax=Halorarum salinum TaxID=2743089 RepID=UPI001FE3124C|nr:tripartite tricarboxylate transporter permease [Halobaculum salinum]
MLVAMADVGVPAALPTLLVVVLLASAAGVLGVLVLGDAALRAVGRTNQDALVVGVLLGLVLLSWGFAGVVGLLSFAAATAVGFVPTRLGCKRVHLMGVLVGPLALGL